MAELAMSRKWLQVISLCSTEKSAPEVPGVPGALAFLGWQFELTSPIMGLFGGETDSLFHRKLFTTAE
jgi:hypothetical protein